jgi:hypothetical protein
MVRLLVLTLLSMPVLAQQTDLDAAFRGASRRAGLWVASLSQTEQALFPPGVRALYLNIWMTVDGEESPARTETVERVAGAVDPGLLGGTIPAVFGSASMVRGVVFHSEV